MSFNLFVITENGLFDKYRLLSEKNTKKNEFIFNEKKDVNLNFRFDFVRFYCRKRFRTMDRSIIPITIDVTGVDLNPALPHSRTSFINLL